MTSSVNHKFADADAAPFLYEEAFSRNIGWVTEWEQQTLRGKKIAIAGMGGVGGVHLLTLVRMGFRRFHISDMDTFEQGNFNRQVGAMMSTVGRAKAETLKAMALDINPQAEITVFENGIHSIDKPGQPANLEAFLDDVDLMIDGFDFFVLDVRADAYRRCREKDIPVVCAAPIGMGCGYLVFTSKGMSFQDYFGFRSFGQAEVARLADGDPAMEQAQKRRYVDFLLGLTPLMLQTKYAVDKSRVSLSDRRGPSTGMSCQICAGVAGVQAVKLLLGRGEVLAAPYFHYFDPYLNRFFVKRLWWGHRNPVQFIKRHIGYRFFNTLAERSRPREQDATELPRPIDRIFDLGRWAPSGDNSQPWSFKILNDTSAVIQLSMAHGENIYEYNEGEPTWLAAGMLLETLRLAASREGMTMDWHLKIKGEAQPRLGVHFQPSPDQAPERLADFITCRSVDRGVYRKRPLTEEERRDLEDVLGPDLSIRWFDSPVEKKLIARLNAAGTNIRLTIKETFAVHQAILDFDHRFSRTGLPADTLGLDPGTRRLMRWLLKRWWRMRLMIRTLRGVAWAKYLMDRRPGLNCAAHFAVSWKTPLLTRATPEQLLEAGIRLQRFWLLAEKLGLKMQPSLAPLCFAAYGRQADKPFEAEWAKEEARNLRAQVDETVGPDCFFLGRIGQSDRRADAARSIRKPLVDFLDDGAPVESSETSN